VGKPEIQIQPDKQKAEMLGVSTKVLGMELRTLIEGVVPAVMRENGEEYDIRVRLKPGQRDLRENFENTYVPNINNSLINLSNVANLTETVGPATINRQDRARYIQISADLAPNGPGMSKVMDDIKDLFENQLHLPADMSYHYVGQAESFQELVENMVIALALAILFIYLVLASLYESFVIPFTIMLVLPLAICGAIFALWLTGTALDLNSMIGCIMLMGIATKNSILIVDYANQKLAEGHTRKEAILMAGKTRMRPVLMTTFASIAGMLPIAIGLNEASAQRTSMGIAVIGGLISSTMLTLVVVPAAFSYMDRFRVASLGLMKRIFMPKENLNDK
jgi:HAE1 family hydrophobic/amphiphilic exporter-1